MSDYDDIQKIADLSESSFEELAVEHRVEDIAQAFARQFVSYVLKEAGKQMLVEEFDGHAVMGALNELYAHGFDPNPWDVDHEVVSIFAPPKLVNDFRNDVAEHTRVGEGDEPGMKFHGVRIYTDPSMIEDTAIAIHHDAIAPTPLFSAKRPWLVREPKGVVEIQAHGGE